jgi:hypothetical protein
MDTVAENLEDSIITDIKPVISKHINPYFDRDHFRALSSYKTPLVDNDEYNNKYVENYETVLPIQNFAGTDEDFEKWCKQEEKVLEDMKGHQLLKIIARIKRKKWWNSLLKLIGTKYRLDLRQEIHDFEDFLGEYILRMNGFEEELDRKVDYDLYRGMRPNCFMLDMDNYERTYTRIRNEKYRRPSIFRRIKKWLIVRELKKGGSWFR